MNVNGENAKDAPGKRARGPSVAGLFSVLARFLPETLVVAALLFLVTALVIAFRGHRPDAERLPTAERLPIAERLPDAERAIGEASSPETLGESEISPPASREAAPGEPSDPAEFWQRSPDTLSNTLWPPLLRGSGQDWRDAAEEERREMARMIARWMHATASEEQQREFAEHYRVQLDRLSQQPAAGSSQLGDWIPLIHAHLVADEVWEPLGSADRR